MEEAPKKKKAPARVKGQAQDAYTWWNELATIKPNDSLGTKIKRVLIRMAGILFIIIFSPLLLLVLIISFLVAL